MSADLRGAGGSRPGRPGRLAAIALLPVAFGACSWFTDFKEQPKIDPWESASDTMPYRGNPQTSVPTTGMRVPYFVISNSRMPATIDSMAPLANPVAADARSLENGRKYYQINCAVCHGPAGYGNGAATRYGVPGFSVITPITRGRTDGYLYGMIRNGRGMMPPYNRIEDADRWDVVNYLRALQGMAAGGAGAARVDTTPAGLPGQTGTALPGVTPLGPTRPAPWFGTSRGPLGAPSAPAAVPDTTAVPAGADPAAATAPPDATTPPGQRSQPAQPAQPVPPPTPTRPTP